MTDYFSMLFTSLDPTDFDRVLDSVDHRVTDDKNVGLSRVFFKDEVELALS